MKKMMLVTCAVFAMVFAAILSGCTSEDPVLDVSTSNDESKIELIAAGNVSEQVEAKLTALNHSHIEIVAEITYGSVNVRIEDENGETVYLDNIKGKAYPIVIDDIYGEYDVHISTAGAVGHAVIEVVI